MLKRSIRYLIPRKMKAKILSYAFVVILVSIISSSLIYQTINDRLLTESVGKVNQQTILYVESHIDSVIKSVNSYSKLIIGDEQIQDAIGGNEISLLKSQTIRKYLTILMDSSVYMDDIHLFDLQGNEYSASKRWDKVIDSTIMTMPLIEIINKDRGSYSLHIGGGGIYTQVGNGEFVSFIRAIKDLDSQEIIGIMVINIPSEYLLTSMRDIEMVGDIIVTDGNQIIAHSGISDDDINQYLPSLNHEDGVAYKEANHKEQLYLSTTKIMPDTAWYVTSIIILEELNDEVNIYKGATLVLIVLNMTLLFISVTLFSRFFLRPIHRMISKIKKNGGRLEEISLKSNIDEMMLLENEYNSMIRKIKALIKRTMNEQELLRKTELDLLQSQIKPHFLYNTLDTIKLLTRKGNNKDAYEAVKALGKFYRTSLGKGKETITIREELAIVESYLKIQNYRYKNTFEFNYYLDPEVAEDKVLRLILQPLIENALYHGIRPKGEMGCITVAITCDSDHIFFKIKDDGVGCDENDILNPPESERRLSGGFGVKNTIERLKYHYGESVGFTVTSEKGVGTEILIAIPKSVDPEKSWTHE